MLRAERRDQKTERRNRKHYLRNNRRQLFIREQAMLKRLALAIKATADPHRPKGHYLQSLGRT